MRREPGGAIVKDAVKRVLTGKTSWPLLGVLVAALVLLLVGTGGSRGARSEASPEGATSSATRAGENPILGWLGRDGEASATRDPNAPPTCSLATLPDGVLATVALVRTRGTFPVPGVDGETYVNRQGLLPAKQSGYYREYTTAAKGGGRTGRLVTGGVPSNDPPEWYYSGDGYQSICEVTDVP